MAGKATSFDPGSHTFKLMQVRLGKRGVQVLRFVAVPPQEGAEGLAASGIPLRDTVAGLSGRDMVLRYTQVPPSPDWQLRNLMELEIQDLASQSGGELSADYNLLAIEDEEGGMETVLMALARNEALERVAAIVRAAGGSVAGHVPDCIALYNAYLRSAPIEDEDEVVCLANLGRETTDIAIVRGSDLLFARNLGSGGKVLDDAIAAAFNVSERKAEQLKRDLLDLDPASRGRYASGQAEKVTMAAAGAASMIVSAIQSSVAFCANQTKIQDLRLDRILVSGGTARVRGLRGMLREALRCPVEPFDPFVSADLSTLPADEAEQLQAMRLEAVPALGLALSRLDPELYSLEILPEHVKRRQRFVQRTIYDLAAGAVGVLVLVGAGLTAKENVDTARAALAKVRGKVRRVEKLHSETEKLIAANARTRDLIARLRERAVPLDGSLRALRALRDTLPGELWLTSFGVERSSRRTGSRREVKPIVKIEGAGKPVGGRDHGAAYREFRKRFTEHPLIAPYAVTARTDEATSERTSFTVEIDFLPEPATPASEREDD